MCAIFIKIPSIRTNYTSLQRLFISALDARIFFIIHEHSVVQGVQKGSRSQFQKSQNCTLSSKHSYKVKFDSKACLHCAIVLQLQLHLTWNSIRTINFFKEFICNRSDHRFSASVSRISTLCIDGMRYIYGTWTESGDRCCSYQWRSIPEQGWLSTVPEWC